MTIIADAYRTFKFTGSHPLNQEYKINALIKFIKRQLGRLMLNTSVIKP